MKNFDISKISLVSVESYLSLYGLQILGAIAIFVIGRFIAGIIRKAMRKLMGRNHVDPTLIAFISNVVYVVLLLLVAISALSNIGVNTNSLAAMIGAGGLAIGLAFQSSLSNVASGIIIILFHPFRLGDEINTNGVEGVVEEIDIMMTQIRTGDNKRVIIPNSLILTGRIVNNNVNATRRAELAFGISYGDDIDKARAIIKQLIDADTRIMKDPAPFIGVTELSSSRVNMAVRVWTKTPDNGPVHDDLYENIKTALGKEGFTMQAPGLLNQSQAA